MCLSRKWGQSRRRKEETLLEDQRSWRTWVKLQVIKVKLQPLLIQNAHLKHQTDILKQQVMDAKRLGAINSLVMNTEIVLDDLASEILCEEHDDTCSLVVTSASGTAS